MGALGAQTPARSAANVSATGINVARFLPHKGKDPSISASTHWYRDQSLLYRNWPGAGRSFARQTIGFREGRCPHFVEQLQILSREPAADWHQPIGHHLIKSRHGDAEIFRGLDAGDSGKRARKGYWPYFRPIALIPHLGWQSCRSALSSKSIRLSLGWMVRKQVSSTLMYRHQGTRFEPDHFPHQSLPNQSDLRV